MIAVFQNELRLLLRDRGAVLWLLAGPILVISLITGARYGGGAGRRVLLPVVNEDQGPVARAFIKLLATHADAVEMSRAEAESLVRDSSRAPAAIVFPSGLSKRYLQGHKSSVLLLTDPAEPVGLGRVKLALLLMDREAAEIADPIGPERLRVVEQNLTGNELARKSHEQNVPGFTIMFTLLAVVYGTAASLHLEARSGTPARLLIVPGGFTRVVVGKLVARFAIGAVQMLVLLCWGWLVFGISLGSSVLALLTMVAATAFAAVALGVLAAGIGRSEQQVLPLSLALVLPLSAIAGLWWPLHAEPTWMRTLALFAFPTWAMRGVTDLVLRDRGLAAIAPSAGMTLLQGSVLLLVGVRLFAAQLIRR